MRSIVRAGLCLAVLAVLSACASRHAARTSGHYASGGHYTPPGPASDPWGPYIHEAATRFSVPEVWVREVMHQESGGQQYYGGSLTTSSAGAMGLMQVMPETYDILRDRYGLGDDPYDPHNNILAGTAYIREMYDKYGSPGFLAAYNAGPGRLDSYLNGGSSLPDETVNYVARIAPRLGTSVAMTGPLAVYGPTGTSDGGTARDAYAAPEPIQVAAAAAPSGYAGARPTVVDMSPTIVSMEPIVSPGDYGTPAAPPPTDPPPPSAPVYAESLAAPARMPPAAARPASPAPPSGFRLVASPPPVAYAALGGAGSWGIQVGAYANAAQARAAADNARNTAGALPIQTQTAVGPTTRPDGSVLFRARLVGLTGASAEEACRHLRAYGRDCIVVPPMGNS